MSDEGRALCVLCRLGSEQLAVRVADVHKVVGNAQISRLPRLPPAVAGITHHRGRIVTVFDAAALLFGSPPASASAQAAAAAGEHRVLVLERAQRHLALGVDAVDEIEPVRLGADLPSGPCAALRVAQHRDKAVFAVDADRLLEMMLQATEAP
jgi:chemotaxis signal transduction protein